MQDAYYFCAMHLGLLQKRLLEAPEVPEWVLRHVDECLEIIENAEEANE